MQYVQSLPGWDVICIARNILYAQVAKLWMSYHSTDAGTSHVSLSLPHVLGIDARPGVAPEHALVISAGKRVIDRYSHQPVPTVCVHTRGI